MEAATQHIVWYYTLPHVGSTRRARQQLFLPHLPLINPRPGLRRSIRVVPHGFTCSALYFVCRAADLLSF